MVSEGGLIGMGWDYNDYADSKAVLQFPLPMTIGIAPVATKTYNTNNKSKQKMDSIQAATILQAFEHL